MAFRPEVPDDRTAERLQATHWNVLDAHDQLLDLRRHGPAPVPRCPTCSRPVEAMPLCAACGDPGEMDAAA